MCLYNSLFSRVIYSRQQESRDCKVSVCVSTQEPEWLKLLATAIVHHEFCLATHLILSQKVGHKMQNIFQLKAIEWLAWVCTLASVHPLITAVTEVTALRHYIEIWLLLLYYNRTVSKSW